MKIALVHDYLKEYGGAERVLEALHQLYPKAPVYTAFVDWSGLGVHALRLKKWPIKTSWLDKIWFLKKLHSPLRFLTPLVWRFFNFSNFEVVISSSGWFICRGIKVPKKCVHICYLHHPPRHLYGYPTASNWQKYTLVKIYALLVNHFLRLYDFATAQKVDYFISNSQETQRRCWKFYRRSAVVIYPPVNLPKGKKNNGEKKENFYLCVGRLAYAKHFDLAIKACLKLNRPLKIIGRGKDEDYLKKIAQGHSNIEFVGQVSDEKLADFYLQAKALLFPAEAEEFGLVSVEAQAYGLPVIGFRGGGIPETIIEGKTGLLFDELTVDSLIKTIKRFEKMKFDPSVCQQNAQRFSQTHFARQIKNFVRKAVDQHARTTGSGNN